MTAYEVRISDWSSDVCSSDLEHAGRQEIVGIVDDRADAHRARMGVDRIVGEIDAALPAIAAFVLQPDLDLLPGCAAVLPVALGLEEQRLRTVEGKIRSEEHTSELQSLMRISYAVFCLKKKTIAT